MKRAIFNTYLLAFAFSANVAQAEQEIRIIDLEGRTQSVVELDDTVPEKTQATVRVAIGEQLEAGNTEELKGVEVSLVKVVNEREGDVVQTAKTFKSGVATFNSIVPGTYKVRIECEEMLISSAAVTGEAIVVRGGKESAPAPESLDKIHLLDQMGTTRGLGELPLGQTATVNIAIADGKQENKPAENVRVLLVEVDEQTEEELEVLSGQFTNKDGLASFATVPGGFYKIRIECPRYNIGGIKFAGDQVLGCLCPWNAISAGSQSMGELAAPVTTSATTSVGLSATTLTAVAPPAVAGAVTIPAAVDTGSSSTTTSQEK